MKHRIVSHVVLFIMLSATAIFAQNTSVLTVGLDQPTKIINAAGDSLLVAENGTFAPNTGRISVVNTSNGARRTLIGGLPSGVNNLAGQPDVSGPSGLALRGNTLYVTIGTGDATMSAGAPGLEAPNPNPSSPLFDSVLELNLPGGYQNLTNGFTLTPAQQAALANGATVTLSNGGKQKMTVRLVANLPDFVPSPRFDSPMNIRSSNLFGVEIFQKSLYVVDASRNLIYEVDQSSGAYSVFVEFPSKPNPLFPFGGPFVEPVPDNIHRVGNRLLVPLLTGFPFIPGFSEVQTVSLKSGESETLIPNLSSAIDVLQTDGNSYYTLEFSTNQLANQPGRLQFFAAPDAAPATISSSLISPTSMALDDKTGNIFVAEIFTGRIIRVHTSSF